MGSMINLPPQPRKRSQRRCLRGQPLPLLRATLRTKQEIAKPTRQTVAKPAPGQHGWCVLVAARTTWGRCKPTCRAVFCHSKRRKPACHPWHFAILDGVWQESGGGVRRSQRFSDVPVAEASHTGGGGLLVPQRALPQANTEVAAWQPCNVNPVDVARQANNARNQKNAKAAGKKQLRARAYTSPQVVLAATSTHQRGSISRLRSLHH